MKYNISEHSEVVFIKIAHICTHINTHTHMLIHSHTHIQRIKNCQKDLK